MDSVTKAYSAQRHSLADSLIELLGAKTKGLLSAMMHRNEEHCPGVGPHLAGKTGWPILSCLKTSFEKRYVSCPARLPANCLP